MKPVKTFTKCNLDNDQCYCDGCFDDDDNYMLEKLYDMKNDIDFMIQVLEHRQEKEKVCQNILSYEDECDCEYECNCYDDDDAKREEFLNEIRKILEHEQSKRTQPIYTYPWTLNKSYPWRIYF